MTARWLKRNAATMAVLKAHPDLFEIENHGAMHVPAVDRPVSVYGIAAAGSAQAVETEVAGGAEAIAGEGLQPHWFRGATAKYSLSSIGQIRQMGFRVAGYSVNGDGGSLLGAGAAEKRIAAARDGDVIIAHINQPTHAAGAGVVKGILDLKAKGYAFVRLDDGDGRRQRRHHQLIAGISAGCVCLTSPVVRSMKSAIAIVSLRSKTGEAGILDRMIGGNRQDMRDRWGRAVRGSCASSRRASIFGIGSRL